MKDLEKEIKEIKQRNKRVELDKKWETSLTRRLCICLLTYVIVVIYSYLISKVYLMLRNFQSLNGYFQL